MFKKKDIKKGPNELTLKFMLGQTVRVKTKERNPLFEPHPDGSCGRIGTVNSIAGFGNPISKYEIGVIFKEDREDIPPTIFTPEDLETLGPKFIKKGGNLHEKK